MPMMGSRSGRWLPACGCALLAGCYVYRPAAGVAPEVGSHVAAELTGRASDTLSSFVGPGVTTLRGDVIGASDSGVILAVTSVQDRSGREQSWERERVRIDWGAVRGFQQRHFSPSRSVLLGLALVGSSVLSWEAFQEGTRGGGILPGGTGGAPK
jgi:hypothetical protein